MKIDTKTFRDSLYDKYKNGKLIRNISPVVLHSLKGNQLVEIDATNSFNVYLWHLADMQSMKKAISVVMLYSLKPPGVFSHQAVSTINPSNLRGFSIFPSNRYRKGNFILEEGVRAHCITSQQNAGLRALKDNFPDRFSYSVRDDIDDDFVVSVSIDCSAVRKWVPFNKIPFHHCYYSEFDRYRETFSMHLLRDPKILHLVKGISEDLEFDILGCLREEWEKTCE